MATNVLLKTVPSWLVKWQPQSECGRFCKASWRCNKAACNDWMTSSIFSHYSLTSQQWFHWTNIWPQKYKNLAPVPVLAMTVLQTRFILSFKYFLSIVMELKSLKTNIPWSKPDSLITLTKVTLDRFDLSTIPCLKSCECFLFIWWHSLKGHREVVK